MFKAIAQMRGDGIDRRSWQVVIGRFDNFADAERAALRYAQKYIDCIWVQVLPVEEGVA